MNTTEKNKIKIGLERFCKLMGSQNKAARAIGVNSATLSRILKEEWNLIAEEMWRTVADGIGVTFGEWEIVETRDFQILTTVLRDAQENSNVVAVTGEAGSGKTKAIECYCKTHARVFKLSCNEYWNRKMFIEKLLQIMGGNLSGTVGEMIEEVIRRLKLLDRPLVVMDEADKLSDQVLYFFVTLYNSLEGCCGIVMCATDYLEKRIKKGLKLNKKGYKEIYSRIGRRFIELKGIGSRDIQAICTANGITDRVQIKEIIEDSEWDLRRVKRKIHLLKNM